MEKDNLTYMEELMEEAKKDETWEASEFEKMMMGENAAALAWIMLDL